MFQYIIQTIGYQLLFLIVYDVILKRDTFFNWNRAYLLGTSVLSFCIPLIQVESFKNIVSQEYIITLPEVFIGEVTPEKKQFNFENLLLLQKEISFYEIFFYAGVCIAIILFSYKLLKMLRLIVKNPKKKVEDLQIVSLSNSTVAFSFFKYIFLGDLIKAEEKEVIIKHEMVHAKQYHSLDLLFFEILRILFWFNPLVYMYQNRMVELHEFIADSYAVKNQNKLEYYESLLQQVFNTQNISFINPFFKQSLIKKRIIMLSKSKSKQINLLKYTLLIPLVIGMLVYSACSVQNELANTEVNLNEFSYAVKLGEEITEEISIKTEKFETFLKTHPEYVGWAQFDKPSKTGTYSIHSINEKVPDNLSKYTYEFPDGTNYIVYKELPEGNSKEDRFIKARSNNDYLNKGDVPFAVIDQAPVFPGCEDLSSNEQKECLSEQVSKHVNENFNTKIASENNLKGRQRINVIFKIDNEGNVVGIRSRAPHPALEEEAIRVIKTLPKMIPGEHQGKKVNVPYSLPILFEVADATKSNE